MNECAKREKVENFYNAAIYIDYENVYKTLSKKFRNPIREGFFDKIRNWAKEKEIRVVKTVVYCNYDIKELYESHHQSLLQSYGVESIHTSNQGKNYADLKIAIDVLNEMYNNLNIDEFIIMSNDKDMTPLLNTIKANKRRVSVITVGTDYNKALVEFADEHFDYDDIISINPEQKLYVDELAEKFLSGVKNVMSKNLEDFKRNKNKSDSAFSKHYSIDFFLPTQAEYYHIMQYELLNIISNYYAKGFLSIYFNQRKQLCILPIDLKEEYIKEGVLSEDIFLDEYDFSLYIREKYLSYCKNTIDKV